MFRRATSLAALTAVAIAGLAVPAAAQDRGRGGNDRRAERTEQRDRNREAPRDAQRGRPDGGGQRGQGGPAGCRGGGSVIGAIAGGLMGSGSVGRPC